MSAPTIRTRTQEGVCFIGLDRPEARNGITQQLVEECRQAIAACTGEVAVIVIEGLADVFCTGVDLRTCQPAQADGAVGPPDPELLYDLWMRLASGPFVSIAHVRGKANAGGVGFVAASDIVIADPSAAFSLSELLFGLLPACVLPFLSRRIGPQRADYMSLSTLPISAERAEAWGLVDVVSAQSEAVLRRQIGRLRCLPPAAISRYKRYAADLDGFFARAREAAVAANRAAFADADNLKRIGRYVVEGLLPWERSG